MVDQVVEHQERKIEPTGWPHVVREEGVRGGRPVIEGTSLEVWLIADYYYNDGMTVEELITQWGHLTPAKIYGALTYYHDHKAEIHQQIYEHSEEYWDQHHAQRSPS